MLRPDDFEVGLRVTVLDRLTYESQLVDMCSGQTTTVVDQNYSHKGHVLEIVAINLPYIVCKRISKHPTLREVNSFDTRMCKFIKLNEEYIKALEME